MHLPPQEEAAALGRLAHIYSAHRSEQSAAKVAFKQKVDDSVAEAMKTGTTQKPLIESDFTKQYGPDEGAARYADYDEDLKFGGDYKNLQTMSDVGQDQFLAARESQPSARGFARAAKKSGAAGEGGRSLAEGAPRRSGRRRCRGRLNVQAALAQYDPKDPSTFKPVIAARLAEQDALDIPPEAQSAATDAEAKQYAAALKPISKPGVPPQNQEQVINQVVDAVAKKYGDHAQEVMSRVLYHVTLKKDLAEVMSEALVRAAKDKDTEGRPDPDAARKVQIERDAQRAAQIAGTAETARSTAGQETPDIMSGSHLATPESVDRVVNQSEQKTQKPFNEAVDMLRSDPSRYMPYFVKKFGVAKVPPDLQQYIPKPKVGGDGG
jgi:hypothetical protein